MVVQLGGQPVEAQRVAQHSAHRQHVAEVAGLGLVGIAQPEADDRARFGVVLGDHRGVRVAGGGGMKHRLHQRMGGQEPAHRPRGGTALPEARLGPVQALQDRRGTPPVGDAAAHRLQVHHAVKQADVVGGQVAPHVAVLSGQRLGAGHHRHVHAVPAQRRFRQSPWAGDGAVERHHQPRAAGRAHLAHGPRQRLRVDRPHQRVGVGLHEQQPRLRPQRGSQPRVAQVVHQGQLAAEQRGQPAQVRLALVVDAARARHVVAGLEQRVEQQRARLHAGVGEHRRLGPLQLADPRQQPPRDRGAVAPVDLRLLRPARGAQEHQLLLAFLPADHGAAAQQVELDRLPVGMQIRHPGASRRGVDALVQPAGGGIHRGPLRPSGRRTRRIEVGADHLRVMKPGRGRTPPAASSARPDPPT